MLINILAIGLIAYTMDENDPRWLKALGWLMIVLNVLAIIVTLILAVFPVGPEVYL